MESPSKRQLVCLKQLETMYIAGGFRHLIFLLVLPPHPYPAMEGYRRLKIACERFKILSASKGKTYRGHLFLLYFATPPLSIDSFKKIVLWAFLSK